MAYKEKLAAHRRAAMLGRHAIREGLKGWVPKKKKKRETAEREMQFELGRGPQGGREIPG